MCFRRKTYRKSPFARHTLKQASSFGPRKEHNQKIQGRRHLAPFIFNPVIVCQHNEYADKTKTSLKKEEPLTVWPVISGYVTPVVQREDVCPEELKSSGSGLGSLQGGPRGPSVVDTFQPPSTPSAYERERGERDCFHLKELLESSVRFAMQRNRWVCAKWLLHLIVTLPFQS